MGGRKFRNHAELTKLLVWTRFYIDFFFVCCCREFCCREFGNRTIYPPNSEFNLQLVFGSRITRIPDRAGYDGISPPLVGDRYFVGLGIEPRAIRMPYGVLRTTMTIRNGSLGGLFMDAKMPHRLMMNDMSLRCRKKCLLPRS